MATTLKLDDIHKSSFLNLFDDNAELATLPLTHKQDWYTAKITLNDGKIKPMPCSVFENENLLYYFYGKPSYSVASNIGSRADNLYFPVCYILSIDSIEIEKVFPFDSGAFERGLFNGFLHKKMDINDFAITPTISQLKGFIKEFYLTNNNYYKNKPQCSAIEYENNDVVTAYVNLINNKGEEIFDERSSSIEILSKTELDLSNHLKAVILPLDLAHSNKMIQEFKKNGVEIITYDTFGGNPGAYNPVIRQLLYNYLLEHGLCENDNV